MTAGADGLFAEHRIDVDIADPPGGPDNVRQVAAGERDFCLTSVHHFLTARQRWGDPDARFVAVVVQRSPLAALVPVASDIATPADLAGIRLGGSGDPNHTIEFLATLDRLGIGRPSSVTPADANAWAPLAAGDLDAVVGFVDALPRARRLSGLALRPVPVGLDVYASGLVAADRLDHDTVVRMRSALVVALSRQREDPCRGVEELCRRYPDIIAEEAVEGWRLLEPNVFAGPEPGSMAVGRWEKTLTFLSTARGLAQPVAERVYRPELAGVAAAPA